MISNGDYKQFTLHSSNLQHQSQGSLLEMMCIYLGKHILCPSHRRTFHNSHSVSGANRYCLALGYPMIYHSQMYLCTC